MHFAVKKSAFRLLPSHFKKRGLHMSSNRPNIVFIMTDQQKRDSLSIYGNPIVQTPNLQRLAKQGTVFDHAYATCPICVPSRVTFFTGRYAHTTRSRNNDVFMQRDEEHLLKILKREGYTTGLSGKNHCFVLKDEPVFDFLYQAGHSGPVEPASEGEIEAKRAIGESRIGDRAWGTFKNPCPPETLGTALTVRHAVEFIEQNCDKPFFLWCSIADPHSPLQAAEPYASMYDRAQVPVPRQLEGEMANKPMAQQCDRLSLAGDKATEEDVREVTAMYYGMNTCIDTELGRLIDKLDELNLRENTLIVYTSDHGEYLGEHMMIRKSKALYDCLTRIPLVVSWPTRLPAGIRNDALVENVDFMPFVLDCLGLEHPQGLQGRSFAPLLNGGDYRSRDATFAEIGAEDPQGRTENCYTPEDIPYIPEGALTPDFSPKNKVGDYGVIKCCRTKDWKLVYYPGNKEGELYDLAGDPGELANLWGKPEHATIQADLQARILDWTIHTEDRRPRVNGK
jgi:arylsulfatase